MNYLGDFPEDSEVVFWWTTNDTAGGSITRATDGTIKVRRDDGTDCTGTSVTDSEDTPATGIHECKIDTSDGANYAPGYDYLVWLDGAVIDGQTVNAALRQFSIEHRQNVYHADIVLTVDDANTRDEWTVTWFKNGVRVTSGITSPQIQVIKYTGGTDLVAATNMTQIGSTGSYSYNEATNQITAGESVIAVATATIDGSSREFARIVTRDD